MVLRRSAESLLGGQLALQSSLARRLSEDLALRHSTLANRSLTHGLELALGTLRIAESSIAHQLEASARLSRAVMRHSPFERSLKGMLDSQRTLSESVAAGLQKNLNIDKMLRGNVTHAFEAAARNQEVLAASLRSLNSFGAQRLSELAEGLSPSLPRLRLQGLSGAFGGWHEALGHEFVADIERAFETQVEENREVSIEEAVAAAVGSAMENGQSRTDWRWVVGLIVTRSHVSLPRIRIKPRQERVKPTN